MLASAETSPQTLTGVAGQEAFVSSWPPDSHNSAALPEGTSDAVSGRTHGIDSADAVMGSEPTETVTSPMPTSPAGTEPASVDALESAADEGREGVFGRIRNRLSSFRERIGGLFGKSGEALKKDPEARQAMRIGSLGIVATAAVKAASAIGYDMSAPYTSEFGEVSAAGLGPLDNKSLMFLGALAGGGLLLRVGAALRERNDPVAQERTRRFVENRPRRERGPGGLPVRTNFPRDSMGLAWQADHDFDMDRAQQAGDYKRRQVEWHDRISIPRSVQVFESGNPTYIDQWRQATRKALTSQLPGITEAQLEQQIQIGLNQALSGGATPADQARRVRLRHELGLPAAGSTGDLSGVRIPMENITNPSGRLEEVVQRSVVRHLQAVIDQAYRNGDITRAVNAAPAAGNVNRPFWNGMADGMVAPNGNGGINTIAAILAFTLAEPDV